MSGHREKETIFDQYMCYSGRRAFVPPPRTAGTRMISDLPYLSDEGHVRLSDLYLPADSSGKLPVIVDVHGGGWVFGSKEINGGYASYLASKGYAVLAINYSAVENADLPCQVRDVITAVAWVRNHADSFGLDCSRLYLCGDSAGAHLALLSYIVGHSEALRLIYGAKPMEADVKAFGLVSPVTDLHFFCNSIQPAQRKLRKRLFGDDFAHSPLRYCASIGDILRTGTHLPPVYLVSSEEDFFRDQSMQLHHLLNRRNVPNQFRYYPAGERQTLPHCFPVLHPDFPESRFVNDEMLAFFRSVN